MIKIYPCIVNSKEDTLAGLYQKQIHWTMLEERSLSMVFYNVPEHELTWQWFIRFCTEEAILWVITEDRKMLGAVWLTDCYDKVADIHYCMFKESWGDSARICSEVMQLLFNHTDVECFMALIPDFNTHAVDKPLSYGFKKVGVIPKRCWHEADKKSYAGHLYYMIRED